MVSKEHVLRETEKMNKSKVKRMVGFPLLKYRVKKVDTTLWKKVCEKSSSCPSAFIRVKALGATARRMCILVFFCCSEMIRRHQLFHTRTSWQRELLLTWIKSEQGMIFVITVTSLCGLLLPSITRTPVDFSSAQPSTGSKRL